MTKRYVRLGMGATLAAGSLALAATWALPAHALGAEGCTSQGANGFIAVGTLTGTTPPMVPPSVPPQSSGCTNPPSATISSSGGAVVADANGGTVYADTAHTAAKDATGMACPWAASSITGYSQITLTGPGSVGNGCILAGATVSATAN